MRGCKFQYCQPQNSTERMHRISLQKMSLVDLFVNSQLSNYISSFPSIERTFERLLNSCKNISLAYELWQRRIWLKIEIIFILCSVQPDKTAVAAVTATQLSASACAVRHSCITYFWCDFRLHCERLSLNLSLPFSCFIVLIRRRRCGKMTVNEHEQSNSPVIFQSNSHTLILLRLVSLPMSDTHTHISHMNLRWNIYLKLKKHFDSRVHGTCCVNSVVSHCWNECSRRLWRWWSWMWINWTRFDWIVVTSEKTLQILTIIISSVTPHTQCFTRHLIFVRY